MSAANGRIFSALIEFVMTKGIQIRGVDEIRYIKSNEIEKETIQYLNILSHEKIARSIEFAIGKLNENNYLIVIGPSLPESNVGEVFEIVSMDAGWFTSIISELKANVSPDLSAYEVANILNDRYLGAANTYEGHLFSEIDHFFPSVSVFSFSSVLHFQEIDLHRIAGIFLCAQQDLLNLDIPHDLIKEYEKLFTEGPDNLPFEELLDSLMSLRWKDVFLDVYRCIERLFPYSYIQSLHAITAIDLPLEELIEIVENVLGWKAKENLALDAIFSKCGHSEECLFRDVKKNLFGNGEGGIGVELVYKLRNSIVHHRLRGDRIYKRIEIDDWVSLIKGLLMVIRNEYVKYYGDI